MWSVIHGEAIQELKQIEDNQFDSIVTDPPYGLSEITTDKTILAITHWLTDDRAFVPDGKGFMGKNWDKFVPPPAAWDEAYRVLKPGGYLLAFAGTRTYDLMCLSIRLAGFEIRDSIHWFYGSGFPKSRDISKAIDSEAGAEREVTGQRDTFTGMDKTTNWKCSSPRIMDVTASATNEAKQWEGWGTALKPAHEPIVMARKPFKGTVAGNVLEYGTGGINVDGCRIGTTDKWQASGKQSAAGTSYAGSVDGSLNVSVSSTHEAGRWPANLVFSHSPDCVSTWCRACGKGCGPDRCEHCGSTAIYGQTRKVKTSDPRRADGTVNGKLGTQGVYGGGKPDGMDKPRYGGEDGTEEVLVYNCAPDCPVAELDRQSGISKDGVAVNKNRGDRKASTVNYADHDGIDHGYGGEGGASRFFYCAKASKKERPQLDGIPGHPTVKPLRLIRYLVRLITQPGGTVLDLFAGSGTTGEACELEGFNSVLIENDPTSIRRIDKRMSKYE